MLVYIAKQHLNTQNGHTHTKTVAKTVTWENAIGFAKFSNEQHNYHLNNQLSRKSWQLSGKVQCCTHKQATTRTHTETYLVLVQPIFAQTRRYCEWFLCRWDKSTSVCHFSPSLSASSLHPTISPVCRFCVTTTMALNLKVSQARSNWL